MEAEIALFIDGTKSKPRELFRHFRFEGTNVILMVGSVEAAYGRNQSISQMSGGEYLTFTRSDSPDKDERRAFEQTSNKFWWNRPILQYCSKRARADHEIGSVEADAPVHSA